MKSGVAPGVDECRGPMLEMLQLSGEQPPSPAGESQSLMKLLKITQWGSVRRVA